MTASWLRYSEALGRWLAAASNARLDPALAQPRLGGPDDPEWRLYPAWEAESAVLAAVAEARRKTPVYRVDPRALTIAADPAGLLDNGPEALADLAYAVQAARAAEMAARVAAGEPQVAVAAAWGVSRWTLWRRSGPRRDVAETPPAAPRGRSGGVEDG